MFRSQRAISVIRSAAVALSVVCFLSIAGQASSAAGFSLVESVKQLLGFGAEAQVAQSNEEPDASTTLVISQAYGGGGGATGTYMFDYVELKNISSVPQSLNGLQLMYGSATGQFGSSSTNIYQLANVTIQPGKYYLVQLSAAGGGGAPLPVTPDR